MPEGSEESSVVGCFQSPLVEMTKRGILISKKKFKYVDFLDLSTLSDSPEIFWDQISVRNKHFPVILVTYADIADPPKLLTTILRYRPSAVILGVPTGQMKNVIMRLCVQHEAAMKQNHALSISHPYDRYQALLSIITAVRAEGLTHISIMNCPLPFPII